jgi:drug/metabolite transporter (DMT)-like permease
MSATDKHSSSYEVLIDSTPGPSESESESDSETLRLTHSQSDSGRLTEDRSKSHESHYMEPDILHAYTIDAEHSNDDADDTCDNTLPAQPAWLLRAVIVTFITCGTASMIVTKIMYQTYTTGDKSNEQVTFQRPLFQTACMFAGMAMCLIPFSIMRWMHHTAVAATNQAQSRLNSSTPNAQSRMVIASPTASLSNASATDIDGNMVRKLNDPYFVDKRVVMAISLPALLDLLATQCQNIGLIFLNASVLQMLRGSIIIFAALVRFKFLHRSIARFQMVASAIVVFALAMIGLAAVLGGQGDGEDAKSSTTLEIMLGIVLVLVGQSLQASQNVMEEYLMQNFETHPHPLLVAGAEGVWGLILCAAIAMPIASNIHSGTDGNGIRESTSETFAMMRHRPELIYMTVGYIFVIFVLNSSGMTLTKLTNAVTKNLLDTLRTLCIWVALTFTHYVIDDALGERISYWSFLQGSGFVVLVFGIAMYNSALRFPTWFLYDDNGGDSSSRSGGPTEKLLDSPARTSDDDQDNEFIEQHNTYGTLARQ